MLFLLHFFSVGIKIPTKKERDAALNTHKNIKKDIKTSISANKCRGWINLISRVEMFLTAFMEDLKKYILVVIVRGF